MSVTFVDGSTPLNAVNLNTLESKANKGAASGYAALDAAGYVLSTIGAKFGADANLYRSGANALTTDGYLNVQTGLNIPGPAAAITSRGKTSTGVVVFGTNVTGDTVDRLTLQADGRLNWGPGSGAADTNLYRSAAGSLKTDGELQVGTRIRSLQSAASGIAFSTSTLAANGYLLTGRQGADSQDRLVIDATGKLLWGGGTAAQDTTLYRSGAASLATDGQFSVGGALFANGDGGFGMGSARQVYFPPYAQATIEFHSSRDTNLSRQAPGQLWSGGQIGCGNSFYGSAGASGGAVLAMRSGSGLSFEWAGGQLKFYVDNTLVKTL